MMTTITKHIHDPEVHPWEWSLADPLDDVKDITDLANDHFRDGMEGVLEIDYPRMIECVTMAAVQQRFNKGIELLIVARDVRDGSLMAYGWFDRNGFTTYSYDEISNQKFIHIRKDLSSRVKVILTYQLLQQHLGWAASQGIPVVCSTSILEDNSAFMKIHKDLGYTVRGSYAYRRTTT